MSQPICVQLYTVRDAMTADWRGTLKRVAQIGYAGVELVYTDQIPASEIKAELTANNLLVSGAHVGIDFFGVTSIKSLATSNCWVHAMSSARGWHRRNGVVPKIGAPLCANSK
jgi:hypothetical protein